MQCRAGGLECVPVQQPAEEKCNAIDDNCDGVIDEGNNLCPAGFVCFRGNCVENCGRGEFVCASGTACDATAGVCVDLRCKDVSCPPGQLCHGGMCEGECVGVKCPYGQACRHGGCVDVCSGLKCDDGFSCTVVYPNGAQEPIGVCTSCSCKGCGTGFTCVSDRCVATPCAMVSCGAGQHCQAGQCVDSCAGAVCPPGQKCSAGQCVNDGSSVMDAGSKSDSGPPVIMATVGTTTGSPSGPTGSGPTGGTGSGAGGSGGGAGARGQSESSCGCRVPGGGASSRATAGLILLAIAALRRARRR
jgi:MYXO-CTERM domain-containing protein